MYKEESVGEEEDAHHLHTANVSSHSRSASLDGIDHEIQSV
jgi:hypothetical protein